MSITFPENKNLYDNNIYKIAKITPSDRGSLNQCVGLFINRAGTTGNGDVKIIYLDDSEVTLNFTATDATTSLTQQYLNKIIPMWIKRIPETDTSTGEDTTTAIFVGNHLYGAFLDKDIMTPNKPPVFGLPQYLFNVDRAATDGTAVGTITWSDPDGDGVTAVAAALMGFTGTSPFSFDDSTGAITYTRQASGAEPAHSTNLLLPVTITDDYDSDDTTDGHQGALSTTQNVILIINPSDVSALTNLMWIVGSGTAQTTTLGTNTQFEFYVRHFDDDVRIFDVTHADRTTSYTINGLSGTSQTVVLPASLAPGVERHNIAQLDIPVVGMAEDGSNTTYSFRFNKYSTDTAPLRRNTGVEIAGYNALTSPTWDNTQLTYVLDPINSQDRQDSYSLRVQRLNSNQIARYSTAASAGGNLVNQSVNFNSLLTVNRWGNQSDADYNLDHLFIDVAEGATSAPADFTTAADYNSTYEYVIRSRKHEQLRRIRLATSTDFDNDSFFNTASLLNDDPLPGNFTFAGVEYPNGTTEIHIEIRRVARRGQTVVANIGTLGTSDTDINTGSSNIKTGSITVSGTHSLKLRVTAGAVATDSDGTTSANGNQGDYVINISEASS